MENIFRLSYTKMHETLWGTAQQLKKRHRQVIQLLKAGKNLSAVARALSASVSSVFRWFQTYQEKGSWGLRPQPTPGSPPKLSKSQKNQLEKVLLKGPLAAGYWTDLWTLKRVAMFCCGKKNLEELKTSHCIREIKR